MHTTSSWPVEEQSEEGTIDVAGHLNCHGNNGFVMVFSGSSYRRILIFIRAGSKSVACGIGREEGGVEEFVRSQAVDARAVD